jgi:hypothetical protein
MIRATCIAGLLLVLGLVASSPPFVAGSGSDPCVTVPSGAVACGSATVAGCGISSAEGSATAAVTWTFTATSTSSLPGYSQTDTDSRAGVAYAHTFTQPCATDTCTSAALYADGVLVDRPEGVCFR